MELIKIYQGNLVNARELHQFLVVEARGGQKGEQFNHWIKRMLEYDFQIKIDYTTIGYNYKGEIIEEDGAANFSQSGNQRVSKRDYFLTLDCAKQIAMIQNNDKGREARKYFIEAEKTLHQLKENKRLESFLK
ncbi:MAG: antA/AntB antirepressor family protein, partial [Bacteroidota bacterium]